jgi:YHS domain-containing protein
MKGRTMALRRIFMTQLVALITAAVALPASSAQPPYNTLLRDTPAEGRGDVAIRGYDMVAYFTQNKAVPGTDAFVTEWMGAKWRFASQQHLDRFKASPAQYAPQYGGYCAYGVSQGYLVKVDPEQWSVIDGKLYLNYDAKVQAIWKKDTARYIKLADSKFRALLNQ